MTQTSELPESDYKREKKGDIHIFILGSRRQDVINRWLKDSRAALEEAQNNDTEVKILHDLTDSGLFSSNPAVRDEAAAQRKDFKDLNGRIAVISEDSFMIRFVQFTLNAMARWQKIQYKLFFDREEGLAWLQEEA